MVLVRKLIRRRTKDALKWNELLNGEILYMSHLLICSLKLSLRSSRLGKLGNVYNVRSVHAQSDLIVGQSATRRVHKDQLVVMNITYVRHSLLSENLMKHTYSSNKWTITLMKPQHKHTDTYMLKMVSNPIWMTTLHRHDHHILPCSIPSLVNSSTNSSSCCSP